jgi:hypothetical protein
MSATMITLELLERLLRDEDGDPRWYDDAMEGPWPVCCGYCFHSYHARGTLPEDVDHSLTCPVPEAERLLDGMKRRDATECGKEPTERAIIGRLIREFESDENWPDNWCYSGDPEFATTEEEMEETGLPMVVDSKLYDVTGIELDYQGGDGYRAPKPYWTKFKEWYDRAYPREPGAD